jgi:hypothetical protein
LARQLHDAIARRERRARRGRLDIKRTLARAARTGGVPLSPVYRKRVPRKARVVALCDLSRSVEPWARFLFALLHAIQGSLHQVRTFAFVSKVDEVTGVLRARDVNAAMDELFEGAAFRFGPASDYGLAFQRFAKKYPDALSPRTTLIVLGDARNNFGKLTGRTFARIAERCRRVIWLNPEPPERWDTGDSVMETFARHVTRARQISRLADLVEFVDELAGRPRDAVGSA